MGAQETAMQEKASLWIFEQTLAKGSRNVWETADDLINDKKYYQQVCNIYPALKDPKSAEGREWLETIVSQSVAMRRVFVHDRFRPFNEFDHSAENGFMHYISNAANKVFGYAKKDTWNPADVWCIRNMNAAKKMIEGVIGKPSTWGKPKKPEDGILELNKVLQTLYRNGKIKGSSAPAICGISLKKVTPTMVAGPDGKKKRRYIAHYEEVNLDNNLFSTKEFLTDFKITAININMLRNSDALRTVDSSTGEKKRITSFGSQDLNISVYNALHKSGKTTGQTFNFMIKPVSTSSFNNLKFEPTLQNAGSARLGKAPVSKVITQLRRADIIFSNSWQEYPKTLDEYISRKKEFEQMWRLLKNASGPVATIINKNLLGKSWSETDKLIQHVFTPSNKKSPLGINGGGEPWIGCAKLMELDIASQIAQRGSTNQGMDKINTAFTWLSYSAQKKNRIVTGKFGPFGKLY